MGNEFHDPLGAHRVRRSNGNGGPVAPLLFPTDGWVQAWLDLANTHPNAPSLYTLLDGRWRFVVERDRTGPGGIWEILVTSEGAAMVEPGDLEETDGLRAVVQAPHDRWYKLITGKADLRMSVLTRRVHVVGDLKELREYMKELKVLGLTPDLVPTLFVNL